MSIYPGIDTVHTDIGPLRLGRQFSLRPHLQRAMAPVLAGDFPRTRPPVDFR
jgi:hypothetical protein